MAVFSAKQIGQLFPPNEYGLAEESLLHLISGSSPLSLSFHTNLDRVVDSTLALTLNKIKDFNLKINNAINSDHYVLKARPKGSNAFR